jgi:hypothetical protein
MWELKTWIYSNVGLFDKLGREKAWWSILTEIAYSSILGPGDALFIALAPANVARGHFGLPT